MKLGARAASGTRARRCCVAAARRRRRGLGLVAVALRRRRASPDARHRRHGVLGADGQPWFRLDEQRHDVAARTRSRRICSTRSSRSRIAGSTTIPGIDPIGIARAVVRDVAARRPARRRQHADAAARANAVPVQRRARSAARRRKRGIALLIEAQLTKTQILELYLNRVYLSAGVYGVETMSEHLFRKPAQRRSRCRKRRSIAGLIRRAVDAVAVDATTTARSSAATSCSRRCASRGSSRPRRRQRRAGARPRIQPYRQPQRRRRRLGEGVPAAAVPRTSSAAIIRRTGRCTRRSIAGVQDAAERAVAAGLRAPRPPGPRGGARRARSATGDMLAMVGGGDYARSTFNRATRSRRQPGSAFKPFVYAAALAHGLFAGVRADEPATRDARRGDPEWTPRNAEARAARRADAARGAARVEQRRRRRSAAARRVARGAAAGVATPACSDLPDVPSLALGTGAGDAARSDRGLHDVSRTAARWSRRAACVGARRRRQRGVRRSRSNASACSARQSRSRC